MTLNERLDAIIAPLERLQRKLEQRREWYAPGCGAHKEISQDILELQTAVGLAKGAKE